jgi:hypothetical protein
MGEPGANTGRSLPPLDSRGYSEASLAWWRAYLEWKQDNQTTSDWASFPGS